MSIGRIGRALVAAIAVVTATSFATVGASASPSHTYRVQLDARPPVGEPWAFLRIFPGRL